MFYKLMAHPGLRHTIGGGGGGGGVNSIASGGQGQDMQSVKPVLQPGLTFKVDVDGVDTTTT